MRSDGDFNAEDGGELNHRDTEGTEPEHEPRNTLNTPKAEFNHGLHGSHGLEIEQKITKESKEPGRRCPPLLSSFASVKSWSFVEFISCFSCVSWFNSLRFLQGFDFVGQCFP